MSRVKKINPLERGFYTVSDAARLIEVGNAQRIYGWLKGYPNRSVGPLLTRDYHPLDDVQELSFLDLMEVRFVEHFRAYGVKASSLRIAAEQLKKDYKTTHPFALKHVMLVADKADICVKEAFHASAEKTADPRLRSLLTKNYVMYEAIKQGLLPGVTFDPRSHLADTWTPRPNKFPRVVINPKVACGRPITESGIPTDTIFEAWEAEGKNADAVAYWFGIPGPEVLEAIQFEQVLNQKGETQAA